jgi:hypothetical protein
MTVRHRWRLLADRTEVPRHLQMVRAYVAIGRRRQDWLAIRAAVGNASSLRLSQARKRLGVRPGETAKLAPAQRRTLDVGSCLVLSGLGFGVQLGSWPVWTFLAGIGVYVAWVLLYAEITVQASRRKALPHRARWFSRPRRRGRAGLRAASAPTAKPAQEERPA